MIEFTKGGALVQSAHELPKFDQDELILDFETSSGDPKISSVNPWDTDHCKALGVAVIVDDRAFYVPRALLHDWLPDVFRRAKRWVNHNVKYDYHVSANDLGLEFGGELFDTLTMAKVYDSDKTFRGGYGLKRLSKDWLQEDIGDFGDAMAPWLSTSKDFGRVPTDILAEYGCHDVISNLKLYRFLQESIPAECNNVVATEIRVTRALIEMERTGVRICPNECMSLLAEVLDRMLVLEEALHKEIGYMACPSSNKDCYDVLCNFYGLPVMKWTNAEDERKVSNPCFDEEALELYRAIPGKHEKAVELILKHRHLTNLKGLFLMPYIELHVDSDLHCDYNQSVSSGRMSCRRPNMQQASKIAKMLIKPREGYSFICRDYSQIEYRLIVHYIDNRSGIEAYQRDPLVDFHQWVADTANITRRNAKTLNFRIGFGGGKNGTVKALMSQGNSLEEATDFWFSYHRNLPELKPFSSKCEAVTRRRGYIRNAYGRHLHLNQMHAHKAFSRVVQSTAADIAKEACVKLSEDEKLKSLGCKQLAVVHDEFLAEVPHENLEEANKRMEELMDSPSCSLSVPIRSDGSWSDKNWALAKGD